MLRLFRRLNDIIDLSVFTRFITSGLFSTLNHIFFLFIIINFTDLSLVISNAIAVSLNILIAFFINTLWTFKKEIRQDRFLKFLLVALTTFFTTTCIAYIIDFYSFSKYFGILIIVGINTPISFLMQKFWAFKD